VVLDPRDLADIAGVGKVAEAALLGSLGVGVVGIIAQLSAVTSSPSGASGLVDLVQSAAFVVTGIPVMIWTHRLHTNSRLLGGPTRYARWLGWAGWLIPIVSFWVPYRIIGDANRSASAVTGHRGRPVAEMPAWWALFIVYSILSGPVDEVGEPQVLAAVRLVSAVVFTGAAYLAWQVIRTVTRRQLTAMGRVAAQLRAAAMAAAAPPPSSPSPPAPAADPQPPRQSGPILPPH
jgi:hypothetical protein